MVSPDSEMTKLIEKTVLEGSTDSFVVGYLTGVLRQLSSNGPVWLSTTLNRLLEIHPKNALLLTVLADATNTGWDRLKRIFELNLPDTAVLCSRLFGDHWNSVLPGKVLTVNNEDVIEDLEGQVRRMLEFLELPYEEECISFHETDRLVRTASSEQVRKPINKEGMERWKPYSKHLKPLLDSLDEELLKPEDIAMINR